MHHPKHNWLIPTALALGFIACAGMLYPMLAKSKAQQAVRVINHNGCYVFSNGEPLCNLSVLGK